MMRRSFRLGLRLGLLAGILIAVAKVVQSRRSTREEPWAPADSGGASWPPIQPQPVAPEPPAATVTERIPPVKRAAPDVSPASGVSEAPVTGVTPMAPVKATPAPAKRVRKASAKRAPRPRQRWVEPTDGACPETHPVKAKLSSMLYHLPGMAFYNRTRPDRCYGDAASAEADGFIRAKR